MITLILAGWLSAVSHAPFKLHVIIIDLAVVMNRKPKSAWELYLKLETSGDSFNLLLLVANDCYKV